MPKHLSVSQHNTYHRCPRAYKLQRVDKVWQRPASWLSQGLGVHVAMEMWERSERTLSIGELVKIYQDEFIRSVEEQSEETPNFDYWFGSGPYSGPEDIERRFKLGEQQVKDLAAYCEAHPDERIWTTPEGEKAIELGFEQELGGVLVKGFIDQVIEHPKLGLLVRDLKTGAKPGDIFQLATYAEVVRLRYGETPRYGDYFMGRTGNPTKPIEITEEARKDVHERFRELRKLIDAGEFPAKPSKNQCKMCSVATSCEFKI